MRVMICREDGIMIDTIKLTDKTSEKIAIAKKIVESKSSIYTEKVLEEIRNIVVDNLKNASTETIEEMMYYTIYYYWVYGCTVDEFFYYDFSNKSHDEIKTYVTAHEKVIYTNRLNCVADAHLLNNKWDAYQLFKDYYKRDMILLRNREDYETFCKFVKKHPEFVVKPVDMGLGQGVYKENVYGMSEDEIKEVFEKILNEAVDCNNKFHYGTENSVVLEELIMQDDEMAKFHPSSVNGVRITTVRVGDEVHIYHPWFKIGRNGQFVTSAAYGTFDAGIDPETGVVCTPGVTESNECFEIHPDTNVPILGFQIPRWDEAIKLVKELAQKLPTISYVGWDVVLTPEGWCVMEGNFRGAFMWQLFEGRGNKKEFEELIGWKLEKDFWWRK